MNQVAPLEYNSSFDYSKLERKSTVADLEKLLDSYKIYYEKEKSFDTLKYRSKLRYDYWLPQYNLLIEYDGEQHYYEIPHFGGTIQEFRHKDKLKTDFAEQHDMHLMRVPFWYNIYDIVYELEYYLQLTNDTFTALPMIDEFFKLHQAFPVNITKLYHQYNNMLKDTQQLNTQVDYDVFEDKVLTYFKCKQKDIYLACDENNDRIHYYKMLDKPHETN